VVFYLARLILAGCRVVGRIPERAEVVCWSLGCFAYLVHVICAFAFVHQWSHETAIDFTAAETERVMGIRRGEGLWVNYLFTLVWLADVIRLVMAIQRQRPTDRRFDIAVHSFMAFIVFNATVVFGPTLYRWLGIPVAILLGIAWRNGSRR